MIQQFYGSVAILITVMNAQTLHVSQGLGIVQASDIEHLRSRPLAGSAQKSLFSRPILDGTDTPVRLLALDVSSAANQDTIL